MIGVVADDITGANDIGIMYAKAGLRTHVYSYSPELVDQLPAEKEADVIVLDTDSRFDDAAVAYDKVFAATRALEQLGCTQFVNKTCSVFRGNIGAEFDAMLDALHESFALVTLGFPKNGRTTVDGIHYVRGIPLSESEFSHDPVHPMKHSDVVGILQGQTSRKVSRIGWEMVDEGVDKLRAFIDQLCEENIVQFVIVDVRDQADLAVIAAAASHLKVWCGSSALAEESARLQPKRDEEYKSGLSEHDQHLGILVTAGSLMPQTSEQLDYLRGEGVVVKEMESSRLLLGSERLAYLQSFTTEVSTAIMNGIDVAVHSSNMPSQVQEMKKSSAALGMSNTEVSRLVSDSLAEIAAGVLERTGLQRVLVAGGDTSAAFCRRMNVIGMRVWKEIQPGLPSCITLTDPPFLLVLKSGSFGDESFMAEAIRHLRKE
ncbi:four-carbon acid sugar kinase family protein [Paenibacillus faecalis]|uniref:four-carbon acid sugar kinase family protein n=1 Tax=Paenibacillus faecalis TaxID=2079532 RepID=UPI000D0FA7FE|nr:four-carbon acid sugar kinase family protein [Paenibacillus faecalis]